MAKKLLLLPLLSAIIGIVVFFSFPEFDNTHHGLTEREKLEVFLANHPYAQREPVNPQDLKKIPKHDRPDLAAEQNFLMTLDPKLGYPPPDGLLKAYAETERQRNQQMMFKAISGVTWSERGPSNVGGRTRAVMFDPNDGTKKKVWAGGVAGGLWFCNDITNSSSTWTKVNDLWDNLAITSIAYDPQSTSTFYVGTGEGFYNADAVRGGGVWKSTNGGTSFSRLSVTDPAGNSDFYRIQKVMVHPTTSDVYVGTRRGLYRSQNGGTSFTKVYGGFDAISDVEIASDGTIYIGIGLFYADGVYSSPTGNSGTWTKLNTGTNGFPTTDIERIELACDPSNAGTIYAVVQDGGTAVKGVYKTTNAGSTWTSLTEPNDDDTGIDADDFSRGQAWYDLSLAVHPTKPDTIYIGGIDLFISTNGGTSWSQISHWYGGFGHPYVHADQHTIAFRPGSDDVIFGNDGGVFYTDDEGDSFTDMNNRYNVTQFYSCAIHPTTAFNYYLAGAQDNGTQQFNSAGIDATVEVTGGDGAFCFIDQTNATYQVTSYVYNNWRRSTNGGSSFSAITSDNSGRFINPADYDDENDIIYSAIDDETIKRTTGISGTVNEGSISVSINGGNPASHIRVSPYAAVGTTTLFVGTSSGRVYKVTNAHATPSTSEITGNLPNGYISCIEVGADENQLLVTYTSYGVDHVWETTNGGTSWTSKDGDLPDMPVRWALYNPDNRNEVMLATEVGVWSTDDLAAGSVDWGATNGGLANVRVDMLQMRTSGDKEVIAATHGRGLFSTTFPTVGAPTADFSGSPTTVNTGATVTFTDASSGSITSYSWDFGTNATPPTATGAGPHNVTYSTAGTKTVELTVTGPGGNDTETKSNYITVNGPPTADFTGSPTTVGTGSTVTFTDASSGSITSYAWDFGANATPPTATGPGPHDVTYSASGLKTVELTVTGPGGNDTETKSNYIDVIVVPNTTIKPGICGTTLTDINRMVRCYAADGATQYEFRFERTGFDQTLVSTGPDINLKDVAGIEYDLTYNVSVRVIINGVEGSYSTPCALTTQSPTGTMKPEDCGITISDLNKSVHCYPIGGATQYEFRFQRTGFDQTVVTTYAVARVADVSGIEYGQTYNMSVRPIINGTPGNYGATCSITTQAPSATITTSDCGITITDLNKSMHCYPVGGATQYEFRFQRTGFDETLTSSSTVANVKDVPGIEYGQTYNVSARPIIGGTPGSYGATCSLTIQAPSATIKPTDCGITITGLNKSYHCYAVGGATQYEFKFERTGFSETLVSSSTVINVQDVPNITSGNTYTVSVRPIIGGTPGSYGATCSLTINNPVAIYDLDEDNSPQGADIALGDENNTEDFALNTGITVYPNPSTAGSDTKVKITGLENRPTSLIVYDLSGKVVFNKILHSNGTTATESLSFIPDYRKGIYLVRVTIGSKQFVERLLIE